MIPTEVSGSRFPVGSSQTRSGGWLTNARAIETRCCSPPESSSGKRAHLVREADHVQDLRHLAPDRVRALALHLERVGDVLRRGSVRQQLEVLEDTGDVPAQLRDLAARQADEVASRDDDPARGRLELLQQEAHDGRLPRARRADDEDELALVDDERDIRQRGDVRLVDLRHAVEDDHRVRARDGTLRLPVLLRERCRRRFLLYLGDFFRHGFPRGAVRGAAPGC